ncbi:hypothetical protein [Halobaculum marinum]|uniref:PGF-pre-PGF domain-containing protein n=1 Tax=Halobaculum marinum TaxID=3031996 RepID=A0ABD5WSZ5_9EURY|nr:hypothetical protein [Halobaculum sp. DT55]
MSARTGVRIAAGVAAFLLVFQAALAGALVGSATAAPAGMLGVPDSNVDVDLASDSPLGVTQSDLEGAVSTSAHASTTHVTLTSGDRVNDSAGVTFGGSGDAVLLISDDVNHQGREVAVDADLVRAVVGHIPETVTGVHSSGETWVRQVDAGDGVVRFEVPKFSTNQVTFEGEFHASGTFSNGSSLSWDLADLDAASNVTVNATGLNSTETDSVSGQVFGSGSVGISIASDGSSVPANITLSGQSGEYVLDGYRPAPNAGADFGIFQPGMTHSEVRIDSVTSGEEVSKVTFKFRSTPGSSFPVDVYLADGAVDGSQSGTLVASDVDLRTGAGYQTITFDNPQTAPSGAVHLEFVAKQDPPGTWQVPYNSSESPPFDTMYFTFDGGDAYNGRPLAVWLGNGPPAESATVNIGSETVDFPDIAGKTVTKSTTVPTSAENVSITVNEGGEADYQVNYTETTAGSTDPGVELNNCTTAYDGTIPEGQTETLTLNASCLVEGTNRLNVTTGDGTLSADAPDSQVDLDITHDAVSIHEVAVDDTRWRYSYNDSKTWASDRRDAIHTATLPSRVVAIDSVEISTNDGIWQETTDYTLEGQDLEVNVGDVSAGTKTEVRVTASKVTVYNGSITVTDPSTPDESLDTRFQIDSWNSDSYIGVGGTADGARIHYTYNESWDVREVSEITASGDQRLYLPGASSPETARVASLPIEAVLDSGEARFHVADSSTRPTVEVAPGDAQGDTVTYRWLTPPTSGAVLESSRGTTLDDSGANPAILVDDDSEETVVFEAESDGSVSSDSTGGFWEQGGQRVVREAKEGGPLTAILVFGLLGAVVVGYILIRERAPDVLDRPPQEQPYLLGGVAIVLVIGLELLRPGTISVPIRNAVDSAAPLLAVMGSIIIAVGAALALNRWRQGDGGIPFVGDSGSSSPSSTASTGDGADDDGGTVVNIYD